jgi:hypothetical protein
MRVVFVFGFVMLAILPANAAPNYEQISSSFEADVRDLTILQAQAENIREDSSASGDTNLNSCAADIFNYLLATKNDLLDLSRLTSKISDMTDPRMVDTFGQIFLKMIPPFEKFLGEEISLIQERGALCYSKTINSLVEYSTSEISRIKDGQAARFKELSEMHTTK